MTGRTSAASSPSTDRRYVLDRHVRRLGDGRLLLGGEPTRLFRLSAEGAAALDDLIGRGAGDPEDAELCARLVGAGVVHPVPDPGPAPTEGVRSVGLDITVVIPARNPPESLSELLSALYRSGVGDIVVVDDGSGDGGAATAAAVKAATASAASAARDVARIVRRKASGGPACARNAARPASSLVAYLDADTVLDERDSGEWLRRCIGHFGDARVALVAPRIASAEGRSGERGPAAWVEEYEQSESPLDLGPHPGLVGTGRRLSYVPAAGLVVRREALDEVGGFDETLRYGEDVDLLRRLEHAGWLVRYEPASPVSHRAREGLGSFVRQRLAYGTATAAIDRRHPGTVPPYVGTPASTLSGAALLAFALSWRRSGRTARIALLAAAGAMLVPAYRLQRRLREAGCPQPVGLALRLSARSTMWAAGGLLAAIRRVWWPVAIPAALHRRTRRATLTLLASAAAAGHGLPAARAALRESSRASRLARVCRHLGIGVLDDAAYGTGVLVGCWRERSVRALAGRVKAWPKDPPGH